MNVDAVPGNETASRNARAFTETPLFEALARESPDDPCVAFHLGRMRQGVVGIAIVMTEK